MRMLPTTHRLTPPHVLYQRRMYSTRRSDTAKETASQSASTSTSSGRVDIAKDWPLAETRSGNRWASFTPGEQALLTAEWRRRTADRKTQKSPATNGLASRLGSWLTADDTAAATATSSAISQGGSPDPKASPKRRRGESTTRGGKTPPKDTAEPRATGPVAAQSPADPVQSPVDVSVSVQSPADASVSVQSPADSSVSVQSPADSSASVPSPADSSVSAPAVTKGTPPETKPSQLPRRKPATQAVDDTKALGRRAKKALAAAPAGQPPIEDVDDLLKRVKAARDARKDMEKRVAAAREMALNGDEHLVDVGSEKQDTTAAGTEKQDSPAAGTEEQDTTAAGTEEQDTTATDTEKQDTTAAGATRPQTLPPPSESPVPVPAPLWDADKDAIDLILYDVLDTLITLENHPAHYYVEAIAKHAEHVNYEAVKKAFDDVYKDMREKQPVYGNDSVAWWHKVITGTFQQAGVKPRPKHTFSTLAEKVLKLFQEGKMYDAVLPMRVMVAYIRQQNKALRPVGPMPALACKVEEYYGNPFKDPMHALVKSGIATNSDRSVVQAVQATKYYGRHLNLRQYAFVSESLGVEKPSEEFWTRVFERLQRPRERAKQVVMIGDDLYKDAVPAAKFGCRAIWFDSKGTLFQDEKVKAEWPAIRDTLGVRRAENAQDLKNIWTSWRREERTRMAEDQQRRLEWHDQMAKHIMTEENLTQEEYAHKFDPPPPPPTAAEIAREIAKARVDYQKPRKGLTKKQLRKEKKARKGVRQLEKSIAAAYRRVKEDMQQLNRAKDTLKRLHKDTDIRPQRTMADIEYEYSERRRASRDALVRLRVLYEHRLRTFKANVPWVPFQVITDNLKAESVITNLEDHLDQHYGTTEQERREIQASLAAHKALLPRARAKDPPKSQGSVLSQRLHATFKRFDAAAEGADVSRPRGWQSDISSSAEASARARTRAQRSKNSEQSSADGKWGGDEMAWKAGRSAKFGDAKGKAKKGFGSGSRHERGGRLDVDSQSGRSGRGSDDRWA